MTTADAAADAEMVDAPVPQVVTFTYTPSWDGVVSVEVIGGFGTGSDWTSAFVNLTGSGSAWTGSGMLTAGQYPYLFMIKGDSAAGSAMASFPEYAVDPTEAAFVACPMGSPTYSAALGSANEQNPCSQLTVPQGGAPTLHEVNGMVTQGGSAAAGYLVVLERQEAMSHHYFVNRATTGTDGTYSMSVATGNYSVHVEYPGYESTHDAQLVPTSENILRRDDSSAFDVTAAKTLPTVEMAYAGYATFEPAGSAAQTLPTAFTFPTTASAKLDVYGGGDEIGDPFYTGTATTTGSATFAGTFNTTAGGSGSAVAGTKYWWGVEIPVAAVGGVSFTEQTMVYPVTFSN